MKKIFIAVLMLMIFVTSLHAQDFKKVYFSISEYKIYENSNSRYVSDTYPLYVQYINAGNSALVELDKSIENIIEISGTNEVRYKANYEVILLNDLKVKAKEKLYQNRVLKDASGCMVNNIPLATDDKSQALLSQAYVGAKNGLLESGTYWKTESGYVHLTKEQIISCYEAVFNFIRDNFNREKEKNTLIDNATNEVDLNAIDLTL